MSVIVVPVRHQDPTCPGCSRPEQVRTLCAHCGYEYNDEEGSILVAIILMCIAAVILILSVFIIGDWLDGNASLVDVLVSYWKWITSKRVW